MVFSDQFIKNTFLKSDFRPDQLTFDQDMIIFDWIFPIPEDNYHVLMCLPIIICTFDFVFDIPSY